MTGEMDVFFRVRDDVCEHYGIDPWYLIEDRRYTYWYRDQSAVYFCDDKKDAVESVPHKDAEYVVNINGSMHVNVKEVEKEGLFIVAVDDETGSDSYYMVFELKNKVGN